MTPYHKYIVVFAENNVLRHYNSKNNSKNNIINNPRKGKKHDLCLRLRILFVNSFEFISNVCNS